MRIAFRMSLNKGWEEEYKKRHNPIWKELQEILLQHGVVSYSIFLDPNDNSLFAYAEIKDLQQWQKVAETAVCQKWWTYMQPLMPTNEDASPVSLELTEVFHIDNKTE